MVDLILLSGEDDTRITGAPSTISIEGLVDQTINIVGFGNRQSLLTDEVKSALVGAMVESENGQQFIDSIQNKYKEFLDMASILGSMYDVFNKISIFTLPSTSFASSLSYEKQFKEPSRGKPGVTKADISSRTASTFDRTRGKIYTLSPVGEKVLIKDMPTTLSNQSKIRPGIKKVAFVKIDHQIDESEMDMPAINNGALIQLG